MKLDIYVISLSKRGLDDSQLNELICDLPARSIALMEDIDAAFTRGISRGDESGSASSSSASQDASTGITLRHVTLCIMGTDKTWYKLSLHTT